MDKASPPRPRTLGPGCSPPTGAVPISPRGNQNHTTTRKGGPPPNRGRTHFTAREPQPHHHPQGGPPPNRGRTHFTARAVPISPRGNHDPNPTRKVGARLYGSRVTRGLHLPTVASVLGLLALAWAGWWLAKRVRGRTRGFLSDADRATYETLHRASMAARHLGSGLTAEGSAKAVKHVRAMLGTEAVALSDLNGTLAWDGAGAHHRSDVGRHANATLQTGKTVVLDSEVVGCPNPACQIRAAVVSPIVADGRVLGALAAYGPRATAGLARATEEVAGWLSSQVELVDLGRQRARTTEAELAALRAQISPHFIYNSLAAIASFVRTDPDRARELLLEFADFTRYALRKGGAYTSLADELRNIERYLVLEQARFGDRLQIRLLIAPEVLAVTVPDLAIQPLVENAVRHGLATKEGVGTVTITAADRGSDAEIVIEDDGVGADPERIRRILDGEDETDSHGLGNVDSRLRKVYGDDFGLVVETAPGSGTRVSFRIPKYSPAVHRT